MRHPLALLALALAAPALAQQRAPPAPPSGPALHGPLVPGPYGVGFRTLHGEDDTRAWAGRPWRPFAAAVWYPAVIGRSDPDGTGVAADQAPMTLGAYADEAGWGTLDTLVWGRPAPDPDGDARSAAPVLAAAQGPGLNEALFDRLLALPLTARAGPPAVPGRFPLVLLAPGVGYESPLFLVVLAEHLASHGFVVAGAHLVGTDGPLPGVTSADLEAQAVDLALLHREVERFYPVLGQPVAAVGFDLGGMAAVLYGMRWPDLDAVVALDSGVLSARLYPELLAPNPQFGLDRLRAPTLLVTRLHSENEARGLAEDSTLVTGARHAAVSLLRVGGMRHVDFTFYGMVEGVFPGYWGAPAPAAAPGHAFTVAYVADFLRARLMDDPDAGARLALDARADRPAGLPVTRSTRAAEPAPPTPGELARFVLAGRVGDARTAVGPSGTGTPDGGWFQRLFDELLWRRRDAATALALARWWFSVDPETGRAAAAIDAARRFAR
jgi:dienelactone hydrolase